jgi:hypothetical protein
MNAQKITAARANASALARRASQLRSQLPYATGAARTQVLAQLRRVESARAVAAAR